MLLHSRMSGGREFQVDGAAMLNCYTNCYTNIAKFILYHRLALMAECNGLNQPSWLLDTL